MYIELGMLSGIKKQLDEQIAFNENYINDLEETRQAVKDKRWRVVEIVEKAK